MKEKVIKIAAIGDIHVKETSKGQYSELFRMISEESDALLLAGDLCDLGLPSEAELLADDLRSLSIPCISVLGNHDYESDQAEEVERILTQAGMIVLGKNPHELNGIGFAGVKGFAGGFESYSLNSFGERMIKDFVQETLNEVLHLENQLQRIEAKKKVILMHYSPIKDTLHGEPIDIFPFLGSSRFIEPIENFQAELVIHGHAHHGTYEGKTPRGIPVYNVAYPILQKKDPKRPFAIFEIPH